MTNPYQAPQADDVLDDLRPAIRRARRRLGVCRVLLFYHGFLLMTCPLLLMLPWMWLLVGLMPGLGLMLMVSPSGGDAPAGLNRWTWLLLGVPLLGLVVTWPLRMQALAQLAEALSVWRRQQRERSGDDGEADAQELTSDLDRLMQENPALRGLISQRVADDNNGNGAGPGHAP